MKKKKPACLTFRFLDGFWGHFFFLFTTFYSFFFSSEEFSERGCYVVTSKSNSKETVCSCSHYSHFAVLVTYDSSPGVMILSSQFRHRYNSVDLITIFLFLFMSFVTQLTAEDETILQIITKVGLGFSITGILLTIIVYSFIT